MLTPRENFQRMLRHDGPQWLPFDVPTTPPIADLMEQKTGTRSVQQAFRTDFENVWVEFAGDIERWRAAFTGLGCALPDDAEISPLGVVHVRPPAASVGKAYHLREMRHPLAKITTVDQLERLPWPDLADPAVGRNVADRVRQIHDGGRVAHGGCECTVFERAWYQRGMDDLFSDLIEGNGIGDWLLDWHMRRSIRVVTEMARAGVDAIGLGDDVGTQRGMMMSVDFWREHLKPRLRRVIDAIRANQRDRVWVKYHSDGNVSEILDDLVEIGVDILNPVQPECMPLATVIPPHRHHLAFWGMIGTQTTMPFGTTDDVRAAVAECARYARQGAAIVVAPTHVLEPDVPWENIRALAEAVHAVTL